MYFAFFVYYSCISPGVRHCVDLCAFYVKSKVACIILCHVLFCVIYYCIMSGQNEDLCIFCQAPFVGPFYFRKVSLKEGEKYQIGVFVLSI